MERVERWRDVVGYEGRYVVSSAGRVRSLGNTKRPDPRILKKQVSSTGYCTVTLYNGATGRTSGKKVKVCHIVLLAFRGAKPVGKTDACHRDCNKANDTIGNLRWGTRSENMLDTVRAGTIVGESNYNCRLSDSEVRRMRSMSATHTGRELSAIFGVSPALVSGILSGTKRRYV